MIYWTHRLAHVCPIASNWHWDHHAVVTNKHLVGWHWNNFFLYNDTWLSTLDLWFTEVIPTLLFCWILNQWWLFGLYYLWAALIQERIRHNPNFDIYPFITSGRWHLIHHQYANKNYGLFVPIWDMLFGTYKNVKNK